MIRYWMARLETWLGRRKFRKAREQNKELSVAKWILTRGIEPKSGPYLPHPLMTGYLKSFSGGSRETIAYGDSLIRFPAAALRSVPVSGNYAIEGSWSHHISYVIEKVDVTAANVVIGTMGGNPLLAYQSIASVKEEALRCLDLCRKKHKRARMIVVGLPPVFDLWASLNSFEFEAKILEWCLADGNSVFLPLQGKFANGIFPKAYMTSEGVHLSPAGAVVLDSLIATAKHSPPGIL